MNYIIPLTLYLFICAKYVQAESSCADGWEAYKSEKCFKIIPDTLLSYDNALDLCHKQYIDATPLTIHSQQEQDFFSDLLFTKHKIADNVWIGAKVSNKKVTWVDGSRDEYTNWETGEPTNATIDCVEMESTIPNTGKWVDVPCVKKNQVVCQTIQWSLDQIKHMIDELKANQTNLEQTVLDLSKNTVPIGFIYVQLPGQPEPKTLWPKMDWDNITPTYAGLFFRAEGGNSTKFNEKIQEQDSPRLVMVDFHVTTKNSTQWAPITPGVYSNDVYAGNNGGTIDIYHNFLVSTAEVRPRNQAIRIWIRIQ